MNDVTQMCNALPEETRDHLGSVDENPGSVDEIGQVDTGRVVSVVIVNFNAGALLHKSVALALTSPATLEIIVADNGSSDGSLERVRKDFQDDPRVELIENGQNLGFARANNLAIARTQGRYILLLNPDCLVETGALEQVLSAMEMNPQSGMAGSLLRNPDGSEQAGCRRAVPTPWRTLVRVLHLDKLFPRHSRFRSFVLAETPLPNEPDSQEAISGAFMLVRREALNEVGLLDEGYFLHCEDLDWCMRFRQAGWQILFVPQAEAIHYKGYCSRNHPIFVSWHLHKGMVRFYRKFFRRQYPLVLMWGVITAVWFRFLLLASWHWIHKTAKKETIAWVSDAEDITTSVTGSTINVLPLESNLRRPLDHGR